MLRRRIAQASAKKNRFGSVGMIKGVGHKGILLPSARPCLIASRPQSVGGALGADCVASPENRPGASWFRRSLAPQPAVECVNFAVEAWPAAGKNGRKMPQRTLKMVQRSPISPLCSIFVLDPGLGICWDCA